ncbi:MAG TPA: GDP-mannose 4,6-dehydratase [Candidatus Polarisedimenticolia bacterium]|nr:GDP-mannose 4,6-dehydratase [Candidatus Polarisedimenticolia bacterium]
MTVLITGITGFVGSHLAEFLLDKGLKVHGLERWRSKHDNITAFQDRVRLHDCDLRDASAVREVLSRVRPGRIYHLAAQSFVPTSWTAPGETLTTNILGQLNLFEAVRQLRLDPVILVAGSSEEYGVVNPDELPVRETNPLRPLSPYGVSKIGQDLLGYQYYRSYGIRIVRTRAFNHTGPRRGEVFAESTFAKQIALIEKGLQKPTLLVGNLAARRDYTDVRDVVRGYWLALEKGKPGEVYNLCSGKEQSMRQILSILLELTDERIRVRRDPARLRPSDVMRLRGDCAKFRKRTGWAPRIPLGQTLQDLLNYWRERV